MNTCQMTGKLERKNSHFFFIVHIFLLITKQLINYEGNKINVHLGYFLLFIMFYM